ncbi:oligoendopeptidase PepF [Natrialba magadii ATCC 43099]|uniref:Oligoendopeptidase PepF n=1 Tax=Natrialba magadii (strain ATCC 43099 / DSM 3394 / CCM 3739 / CIP 104546 / IAM 13178 / JCM 8861 / NBRC 102185 / NCIMB 2190 / MS3) TaxID=547559 RepID=D3STK8_NATMM|nr:M3 family metallopeptidase [Natrialba magadii]ADD05025.1 oligoendopeptidase PepF [Natrialba magadii ATCC 43099]ELY23399.1 peptidase M3A and M3B thimet/oligopeptidase F [Natrialba magadii ATCC 43099]
MTDYPTRNELDDQYTWDLTRLYETPADWARAADELESQLETLHDHHQPTDSPAALATALESIESALVTKGRLTLYAQLHRNEHPTDERRRDRYSRGQRLAARVDEAVRGLQRRIQRDAASVRAFREEGDNELDGWHAYLDDLLAQAPHTRDADTESVVSAFAPVIEAQTDTIAAIKTADFDPPTVEGSDGNPVAIDHGTYREALENPDRSVRRRAHTGYIDALAEHDHALAAALTEKVRAHAALAAVRNYESVRELALAEPSYPDTGMHTSFAEATHDAVLENVRDHLEAYHGLLESRRELLDVETLRRWDERVPVVSDGADAPEITFEELCEHLLAAVEPLGADYRNRLETLLTERRIDVYPTARKRTDIPAYCPSSPDAGPFVLANFREDVRTAFYLAHELGHAMHIECMRASQPPRYVNSPRPTSEVPSLVHELLLADHLRKKGGPELAPFVRERRAQFLAGNVYGAGESATFLHKVYRTAESGTDLTPTGLSELYADIAAEFRAPVAPPEGDTAAATRGAPWRQQSYIRDPYHNYQYVTGTVAAVSVVRRLQSGALSAGEYLEFLQNTGRRESSVSFDALGVDVTAAEPYERLASALESIRAARLG